MEGAPRSRGAIGSTPFRRRGLRRDEVRNATSTAPGTATRVPAGARADGVGDVGPHVRGDLRPRDLRRGAGRRPGALQRRAPRAAARSAAVLHAERHAAADAGGARSRRSTEANRGRRRYNRPVPEGDTIHRSANRLRAALVGKALVRFDAPRAVGRRPAPGTIDRGGRGRRQAPPRPLRGRHHAAHAHAHDRQLAPLPHGRAVAEGAVAGPCRGRGRGLGGGVLRRPGGRSSTGGRGRDLAHLGPDLTPPDVTDADIDVAVDRMAACAAPDDEIGAVLLDQRVACGVGNVYKSEVLFVCGVDPFTPVAALDDRDPPPAARDRVEAAPGQRRSTSGGAHDRGRRAGRLRPERAARAGGAGRRSGRGAQGEQARTTYWCPTCQR